MSKPSIQELQRIAAGMRAWVLHANKHSGGTSSVVEAITALYFSDATTLAAPGNDGDRLIYSKGHAVAPWYFALWALDRLPGMTWRELAGFGQLDHPPPRMPRRGALSEIHMSSGALGQGLSFGVGIALADRRLARQSRSFVVLGDGECTEGQVWEAAMTAARLGLRNLVALVDANGSGSVITLPRQEWSARWSGFGWHTVDVDGHDLAAIIDAIRDCDRDRPTAIILHTIKGKGLLPPVEGSNALSGEVDSAYLPDWDTEALMAEAISLIRHHHGDSIGQYSATPAPSAEANRTILDCSRPPGLALGHPVGAAPVAKKALGAQLAAHLSDLPMLWMAPDAIRNSGLLERMNEVGSWHWDQSSADVLQCGIAEQDAASLAAGAAAAGLVPVLFSMEGFYWRMLDQIRESIAFQQLSVLLVGTSGGLGDPLGPMVQSDGCLTALSAIPGLEIFEAGDIHTALVLTAEALRCARPAYLRLPHEAVPVRHELGELAQRSTEDGIWLLRDDSDPNVVIATAGAMRETALDAATVLAGDRGLRVRVVEVISPTRAARLNPKRKAEMFPTESVTVSVHNAPSQVLGSLLPDGALRIGVDGYGLSGWPLSDLYRATGLTASAVAERIYQERLR